MLQNKAINKLSKVHLVKIIYSDFFNYRYIHKSKLLKTKAFFITALRNDVALKNNLKFKGNKDYNQMKN